MSFIGSLLGLGAKTDFQELVANGAQIIDVRSPGEYKGGHIKGSLNIPVDQVRNRLGEIKKDKPVITVCASGMRSASAQSTLKAAGYDAYNGGGWQSLEHKLSV